MDVVDRAQFETSLVNLCLNARDAMPKGGRVLIETNNVSVDAALAAQEPGLAPGEYVLITVGDIGHGILPQDLDKVFEPFFTTKADGQKLGPGPQHGLRLRRPAVARGHIAVSSEVDRGRRSGSTCRASAARCPTRRPGAARR